MRIQTILVPTDFGKNAQVTVEKGCELAQQLGAKLYLLHAQDESTLWKAIEEEVFDGDATDELFVRPSLPRLSSTTGRQTNNSSLSLCETCETFVGNESRRSTLGEPTEMANHMLRAEFEMICSNYFSRRRGATAWRFKEGPRAKWKDAAGVQRYTSESGYCDAETKTIWVSVPRSSPVECKALIIHEWTHAVTGSGHGRQFCSRLRLAASRAAELGEDALSKALMAEAEQYSETPVIRRSHVYSLVKDILADMPSASFNLVVQCIARELGVTDVEIHRKYPRLCRIYLRTLRQELTSALVTLKTLAREPSPLAAEFEAQTKERVTALESALRSINARTSRRARSGRQFTDARLPQKTGHPSSTVVLHQIFVSR